MDAQSGDPWDAPSTVAGFATGTPNPVLMQYARCERGISGRHRAVDIGCGAGRNAVPLVQQGWDVVGLDLSVPMLDAARARAAAGSVSRLPLVVASMDALPLAAQSMDLVVAHGIWNLATTDAAFRRAVREAARVSRPNAALFVFTFSRTTLPAGAQPVPGESLVFTQFSNRRQCFLTESQFREELADAGFQPDPTVPLTEHNRPVAGQLRTAASPVIFEGAFRYRG